VISKECLKNARTPPPPPYTLTASEPKTEPKIPPQSLVRKVSLRDIQRRDIHVKGVPANELPSEGYSVNYENSSRQGENPVVQLVGDSLKVHGPLDNSRSNGATISVNGNSTFISGADGSFSFGSVTSHGNNVISTGNFNFGRNASFGVGSTINGIPISDLARQATQANSGALPTLSPITVSVPEELVSTTGTNCRNLNIKNVHGKVHLRQSTEDRFVGEKLHDVFLRSSGNSRSDLNDIRKLEVRASENSDINVNNVSNSSEVVSSGNSDIDIHNANGELEVNASGNSDVKARGGRFTAVNAHSSGNSNITVNGQTATTPNVGATGYSSITVNGRKTQSNNNSGGSSFVFYG
jgi:hypothetical protein